MRKAFAVAEQDRPVLIGVWRQYAAAERHAKKYNLQFGVPVTIFNPYDPRYSSLLVAIFAQMRAAAGHWGER